MPSKHSLKSIRQQHKIFSTWLSVSTCPCSAAILGQTQELWEGQGGESNCLGTASRSWPGQSRLQGTTGASSSAFSLTSPSSGDKSIPLTNCCDWGYSTVAAASLRPCISCWAQIQGQLGATALSVPVETISQPGEGWCQHPTVCSRAKLIPGAMPLPLMSISSISAGPEAPPKPLRTHQACAITEVIFTLP